MKQTAGFIGSALFLTVVFYLLAYYLLPGPPPDTAMVALFAAAALAIAWGFQIILKRSQASQKGVDKKPLVLVFVALGIAALGGCNAAKETPAPQAPSQKSEASVSPERVTGTAVLMEGAKEEAGYGLYSYALLTHKPSSSELPRYRAFLKALGVLPTAAEVHKYVPLSRINVTYLLLRSMPEDLQAMSEDARVSYMIEHYDYARGAVLAASLATKVGTGPVIVSVLKPLDPAEHPRPVLVQDLTLAQPTLMTTYVESFVAQAAKDQFWEQSTLSMLALRLRNTLETAATALNMSKPAVAEWIKFLKPS